MIPCCVLLTSLINAAIPSASGCAAAVGATLIPLMIRSGITPAGAVVVTLVEFVLKDHKGTGQMGDIQTDASGGIDRVNIFSPLLRLFR